MGGSTLWEGDPSPDTSDTLLLSSFLLCALALSFLLELPSHRKRTDN